MLSTDSDWIMRCTGNTSYWEFQVWSAGRYHAAPAVIDHAMIGMALESTDEAPQLAMLMDDRSADLVPPGDDPIPAAQHAGFIEHLAIMHAAGLGWHDDLGLYPLASAGRCSSRRRRSPPSCGAPDVPVPIMVADQGWGLLPEKDPALFELVTAIHRDPGRLAGLLRETPQTFVAGDWKLGNLGTRPSGDTVLLDWAYPGEAPPAWELAWYLALNRSRLPESKEATIARYRTALEAAGVTTEPWWHAATGSLPARDGGDDGLGEGGRATRPSWPGGQLGLRTPHVGGDDTHRDQPILFTERTLVHLMNIC